LQKKKSLLHLKRQIYALLNIHSNHNTHLKQNVISIIFVLSCYCCGCGLLPNQPKETVGFIFYFDSVLCSARNFLSSSGLNP